MGMTRRPSDVDSSSAQGWMARKEVGAILNWDSLGCVVMAGMSEPARPLLEQVICKTCP